LPLVEDEEEDVAVDEIGRGDQLTPVALSVSSAVGREDDAWRIVSRHAVRSRRLVRPGLWSSDVEAYTY
jgi:hypothetical protein